MLRRGVGATYESQLWVGLRMQQADPGLSGGRDPLTACLQLPDLMSTSARQVRLDLWLVVFACPVRAAEHAAEVVVQVVP
jgi:hypothetical protein